MNEYRIAMHEAIYDEIARIRAHMSDGCIAYGCELWGWMKIVLG